MSDCSKKKFTTAVTRSTTSLCTMAIVPALNLNLSQYGTQAGELNGSYSHIGAATGGDLHIVEWNKSAQSSNGK